MLANLDSRMIKIILICASLALIGVVTGFAITSRRHFEESTNQNTLRQVTILMRHGERAPIDTYPKDPYFNSTMDPYGWGQLTNKGRLNIYHEGEYLRNRYGKYLGNDYKPDKFWLQSTSADRAKMTAEILSSSLWRPDYQQKFNPEIEWQPVVLNYWTRLDDKYLIIWNACPKLTMERMMVDNATQVKKINEENKELYIQLEKNTDWSIKNPGDVASLYATLRAEEEMGLEIPRWVKQFYPDKLRSIATFSYSMNSFNDELKKLTGGPMVSKMIKKMKAKVDNTLSPKSRKMFAYIAHDNTLVNILRALNVWDGQDPDFNCMLLVELHEEYGQWNVKLFEKNSPDRRTKRLIIPGCDFACPLYKFELLMKPILSENYDEDCKVNDPNYIIPPAPSA